MEAGSLDLIGREEELKLLRSAFESASSGARVVTIEGDAGIGKTALWDAGLREARAR